MIYHYSKNKRSIFLISIIILIFGVFALLYSPIVFQEGNPWPQIKGVAQLNLTAKKMAQVDDDGNRYITKNNNFTIIESFMKNKGYYFTEQMGSGYLFKSDNNKSAIVTHKYYSRFYSLWSISENLNNDIAK